MEGKARNEKYGIICRVMIDHDEPNESDAHRTRVHRKDKTPSKPDYRDLMRNGGEGWRREHSDKNLLEWGTPIDYLGNGKKIMLFDTDTREITVVADIEPEKTYKNYEGYYKWRNIIKDGTLCVLSEPIPLRELVRVDGLQTFQHYRGFKDITERQFLDLINGRKCIDGKTL